MVKVGADYQFSQPLSTTTTTPFPVPASPGLKLAEFGLNITTAVNDVEVLGSVSMTRTTGSVSHVAIKVLRDTQVVFAEQASLARNANYVENVPIHFTDRNVPIGFHAYSLRVELLNPPGTVFVIGPVSMSGALLQNQRVNFTAKTAVDFQISQPLTKSTFSKYLLASPEPVSFAEIGVNVTGATNAVELEGVLGTFFSANIAIKIIRDHVQVIYAEQFTNGTTVNPIHVTDFNVPQGFHSYTLTVQLLNFPQNATIDGPIVLSGTLWQENIKIGKMIVDYQISQPAATTFTPAAAIPIQSTPLALAEFGMNVTAAVNDVVVYGDLGTVGFATDVEEPPRVAVQVFRDHTELLYQGVHDVTFNEIRNQPIHFSDRNVPVGFHAYTLTVQSASSIGGASVIGPITLAGRLWQ